MKCKAIKELIFVPLSRSSVVESMLKAAQRVTRRAFRVIVVDSRPGVEGRQLADTLALEGISCTYVLLTAISYIMTVSTFNTTRLFERSHSEVCESGKWTVISRVSRFVFRPWPTCWTTWTGQCVSIFVQEVTKVFLGASAMMSNGTVLSRVGTVSVDIRSVCPLGQTRVLFLTFWIISGKSYYALRHSLLRMPSVAGCRGYDGAFAQSPRHVLLRDIQGKRKDIPGIRLLCRLVPSAVFENWYWTFRAFLRLSLTRCCPQMHWNMESLDVQTFLSRSMPENMNIECYNN